MKKILLAISVMLSGCTTIYFDNGSVDTSAPSQEQWHHNFVFALVEGSAPVNLDNECAGKEWNSVKTEVSFINGVVGNIVNTIGPIWYPKTVAVSCK